MGHCRLHPDAEYVEFEQPHLFDIVLVELAHRKTRSARFDRGAIEQGEIGKYESARMHGDMTRQTVECFDK